MDDLREELKQSRRLKRTIEEQYITQIMSALEAADQAAAAATTETGANSSSSKGVPAVAAAVLSPPKSLTCPISCQLFKDPVILVESGQTYEKSYIQEWLGRGHMKDPLSGDEHISSITQNTQISTSLTFRHWSAVSPHMSSYDFAQTCVFGEQLYDWSRALVRVGKVQRWLMGRRYKEQAGIRTQGLHSKAFI
jgi:hypothetical protein